MDLNAKKWVIAGITVVSVLLVSGVLTVYLYINDVMNRIQLVGGGRYSDLSKAFVMLESLEKIFRSLEFLANSGLDMEDRKREYKNIASYKEDYRSSLNEYKISKESETKRQFIDILESWQKDSEKGVELARSVDAFGIISPWNIEKELLLFRLEHEMLEARTIETVYTGKTFHGGDDPTSCRLGVWFSSFPTNNQELEKTLRLASERDRRFHYTIWQIKGLMHADKVAEARSLISALKANKELVFNHLNEINMLIVKESDSRIKEFQNYLYGSISERRNRAWEFFRQYLEENEGLTVKDFRSTLSSFQNLGIIFTLVLILSGSIIGLIFYKLYRSTSDITEALSKCRKYNGKLAA